MSRESSKAIDRAKKIASMSLDEQRAYLESEKRGEPESDSASSRAAQCSAARARIDHAVRQVWLAYRDPSYVSVDMLTEQDMELWDSVTWHAAIQDRLNAMLPNVPDERRSE